MSKRNRMRARARRGPEAPAQLAERAAPAERAERQPAPDRRRARYRGAPPPAHAGHAIGPASATLERAAVLERAYVVKDFGRLAKVIVAMLVLLAASDLAVNTLLR